MLERLLLLTVFVAAFSGATLALAAARKRKAEGAGPRAGLLAPEEGGSALLLRRESLSSLRFWSKLLAGLGFVKALESRAEEAQLNWSAGRITAMMLLAGAAAYAVLSRLPWAPGLAQAAGVALAAMLPYLYILRRRTRRFTRFEEEFPDVLDSMCRALRAGHPIPAALELAAEEGAPPVNAEMSKTLEEWKLGKGLDQALESLAARLPLESVALFVAAAKLSTRTGGRLGQILGNLAEGMREANALRGEVRAMSAHGRLSAATLTALPVLIALLMMLVNPHYLEILYRHPSGKPLMTAAVVCIILAHFVMRKIVDIRP